MGLLTLSSLKTQLFNAIIKFSIKIDSPFFKIFVVRSKRCMRDTMSSMSSFIATMWVSDSSVWAMIAAMCDTTTDAWDNAAYAWAIAPVLRDVIATVWDIAASTWVISSSVRDTTATMWDIVSRNRQSRTTCWLF